jgi:hypothetical protein
MVEYFQINNRYLSALSQYSLADPYQTAVEIVSSINNYEVSILHNVFATEIWTGNKHTIKDFPLFSSSSFNIYNIKSKNKVISALNNETNNFILYNNYQVYIGVVIPLYTEKSSDGKIISYKIVLYKKLFEFKLFNKYLHLNDNFINSSIILIVSLFIFSLFVFGIPQIYFDINREKNIEKRAIISIKNLIEHSLINQENILKYGFNIEEKISKSLYHNNEAQNLLKNVHHEDIDVISFLNNLIQDIYCPENINLFCRVNIKSNILFSKNLLSFAFSTIIYNASHPSVAAKNIIVDIYQMKFKNEIIIEISNDGEEIIKENRKKIFTGLTTKKDGHGLGLKNLKSLLQEAGSSLHLLKIKQTTFVFNVKTSSSKNLIHQNFKLEKKNQMVENNNHLNSISREDLPFVVIIEDEKLIWDAWKVNMTDANILFFENPDDFFFHCDIETCGERKFISKIKMIICDFDFGNNVNLAKVDFFESLEKEKEKFDGYFVLCTGFNESILERIPKKLMEKIDYIYQKRPINYSAILKKVQNKKLKE